MTIQEAHYQFKLNMDRIDSHSNADFNKAEIDWLLNEARLIYIKKRFNPSNLSFEESLKRIEDLANLVVTYPEQPEFTLPTLNGVAELKLSTLKYPHLFITNVSVVTESPECTVYNTAYFVQHDDLNNVLRNPFRKKDVFYTYAKTSDSVNTSLYFYNLGTSKIRISYIKNPSRISSGGYPYLDGIVYPTTSSLEVKFPEEVVDIATNLAALNIESPEYVQLRERKLMSNE